MATFNPLSFAEYAIGNLDFQETTTDGTTVHVKTHVISILKKLNSIQYHWHPFPYRHPENNPAIMKHFND